MFKARGLVAVALDILANKGHFHLAKSTQEFLIAKGFANVVCQIYNGKNGYFWKIRASVILQVVNHAH